MTITEVVQMQGHLIDSGALSRALDDILESGADYEIQDLVFGKTKNDESTARILISHEDDVALNDLLVRLQNHGVNPVETSDAELVPAPMDGVFPEGFHSSTNFETFVRITGDWVQVRNPEMDCGLVLRDGVVTTVPMSDVLEGEPVVIGFLGVKVIVPPPPRPESESVFEFMNSVVSSEKPQALQVRQIADQMRDCKAEGKRILWVGGPAIVHTGGAPALSRLVEAGYVDVLFAGNALAVHDIESNMYGTSLGVDLSKGSGVDHGHENHIRAINRVRSYGSIAGAVAAGAITDGLMYSMVKADKPFVLVGSVRDDGPLPDVYTDVIEGQRAMRAELENVGFSIMVATMLHAIATGNILPASIPLVCVDINPSTVTKLSDRGSAQAQGVVTDIGLFLEQLALELVG
ncbi:MAG: TIGR00300 family protein [Actinobacteria bacterium]|nr:TIGR00300 family protein [Actinomycetota bacterium]MCB8995753.1 TIGR00300 family protein [Actinomycetota bacterium]MCB9414714.1 TIGR00300 family protein [Actinomycetota bacterium]MCB9424398.1 TIGR00300 family protein [Actinomycetota bacterium]HRY11744.1 TIGR00300 family protein [Candidatus Nanopelagicales bacterium]